MELPFEIIKILQAIGLHPEILVLFSALHPFVILLFFIPLWILNQIGFYRPKDNLSLFKISVTIIVIAGWIMGFSSQILLLLLGISGLKMLLIYLSMYLCIIIYVIFNGRPLLKYFLKETVY